MFCKLPLVRSSGFARLLSLGLPAAFLIGLLAFAGCGKGGDKAADQAEDVVLAEVGNAKVMSGEYERRLAKQELKDLPRGEDGATLDMGGLEGKRAFLETLINKELMRQKAIQLGYPKEPKIAGARASLTDYHSGLALWEKAIAEPSGTISVEELQDFYDKMDATRHCRYLITNFLEDAQKARTMAMGGADWDDVAAEYHDGEIPPTGKFEIEVPFGRYGTDFEDPIFAAEIGDITEPILTSYGYWVVSVDEETRLKPGKKPDLEASKAQILDTTYNRKLAKARNDFQEELRAKYKLTINEDALWLCYQGLPADEVILDPETNQPVPQEELKPLDIKPADFDMPFYSYEAEGEVKAYTLGDYKVIFDRMNVFQRPKKNEFLGGLRQKIKTELDKALVNLEAKARNLAEEPDVAFQINEKMDEIMITKLFNEVVKYDERVTPEDLDAFWAEHSGDYAVPRSRNGRMVVCRDRADADKAYAAAMEGVAWRELLVQYGTDRDNKAVAGRLEAVSESATGPVRDALFALAEGEISEPVDLGDGRFAVVRFENEIPGRSVELREVTEEVGKRIKKIRQEEAFQALLVKWREEFPVTVHEENLADLPSWDELTRVETPENLVPRN
ncbi:peptidyl-prolyl cis-trans isomerase [bacterium]|nr:peptidyl-prolyl cis-trans isomerase [bacterium]